MNEYRVDLDAYNGPLELLLYLIRKEEIEIYDIPIARVAEQYIRFVEIIKTVDPNSVGDFLVMLATLMEIKSRALLPRHLAIDDEEEDFEDPRLELVRQLLAYKSIKDAALQLDTAGQVQALRYPLRPGGLPSDGEEMDIEDCSIWTLMNAFTGLLEATGKGKPIHEVVVDDTPIALHAADITDSLEHNDGSQLFEDVFGGRTKIQMIGLFLALLELIRQRRIRVTQDQQFGPITIHLVDVTPLDELDESDADRPFAARADDESVESTANSDAGAEGRAGSTRQPSSEEPEREDETGADVEATEPATEQANDTVAES